MLARMLAKSTWLWLALSLMAASAAAQTPEPGGARQEARERFDRGLGRYAEGDFAGALAELERAQALMPNEVVLFNIGLVYAALKRPVEAVAALDRILAGPGALSAERLAHARTVRDEQAGRIAELSITSNVPATIEIDGLQVGQTPLGQPLRVASGTRHVALVASGYIPSRRELVLAGGRAESVSFELMPSDKLLAHVAIASRVPGAEVWIDGERVGLTPLPATLAVAPGARTIELRRTGYVTARHSVTLGEGATAEVRIDLEENDAAPLGVLGRLAIVASEREISVAVDGRALGAYRESVLLPVGPHRVRIERGGFEPVERDVEVRAGETTELRATLTPTAATRLAHVEGVHGQERWGVIATASGAALLLSGGIVGVWAQGSLPALERELIAAEQSYTNGSDTDCDTDSGLDDRDMRPTCLARIDAAAAAYDDRALVRTLGFVGFGIGVAATTVGLVLLLTNDDEDKYEPRTNAPPIAAAPLLAPGLTGASVRIAF